MTRRERVLAILQRAKRSNGQRWQSEHELLADVHASGDQCCTLASLRMQLRGLGDEVRCVQSGCLGMACWESKAPAPIAGGGS